MLCASFRAELAFVGIYNNEETVHFHTYTLVSFLTMTPIETGLFPSVMRI